MKRKIEKQIKSDANSFVSVLKTIGGKVRDFCKTAANNVKTRHAQRAAGGVVFGGRPKILNMPVMNSRLSSRQDEQEQTTIEKISLDDRIKQAILIDRLERRIADLEKQTKRKG